MRRRSSYTRRSRTNRDECSRNGDGKQHLDEVCTQNELIRSDGSGSTSNGCENDLVGSFNAGTGKMAVIGIGSAVRPIRSIDTPHGPV